MTKWIVEIDCGTKMLRCEACNSRAFADHYRKAVGLMGYDYCPYCGDKKVRPKEIQEMISVVENKLITAGID